MDEESLSVVRLVRQWSDKEIVTRRMEYREDYEKLFFQKRKMLCIDLGLQKLTIPADLGGFGWNSPSKAPAMLALACETGRADASIGILSAASWALFLMMACQHNQNDKLCGSLVARYSDETVRTPALILTGPGRTGMQTPLFFGRSILACAEKSEAGFTLNGKDLRPLIAGGMADFFCVVCADGNGKPGIAFVSGDAKGVMRGPSILMTGLNACGNAPIDFNHVPVPVENVLDQEGNIEELYTWLNLLLGGVSVGAAMNFFELLADWSDNRTIKGGVILKENPLCASVLADVACEIALARLLLGDLAALVAEHMESGPETIRRTFTYAEMIGHRVQQGVMHAMNRGLELMGSAGYAKEWHVEKHWRDVKTIQSILYGVAAEAPLKMDTARFFYNCTEI
ncbi:MAG: acyl-CoA dehydrogenase family protein [Bacteroidota bacterium]|nr:acyl-CoA dehydrogenase family protein [Bacteroidota bacterium]